MKVSDFDFYLPEELIAQHPLEKRDTSRLMVLNKETGEIEHKRFYDIIDYLEKGDTLVLNNTRVLPARLIGEKEHTGGKIEFLLLKRLEGDKWECLAKPGKSAREGRRFTFGDGKLKAEVVEVLERKDGWKLKVQEASGDFKDKIQGASGGVKDKIQGVSDEAMEKIADLKKKYKEIGGKGTQISKRLLKAFPRIESERYREAMEDLKKFLRR